MTRNMKLLIVALLGLAVVCACSTTVLYGVLQLSRNVAVATDEEGSAALGASIATYDAPPGYHETVAVKVLGIAMVTLESDRAGHSIMLMQFPANAELTQGEMELQFQQVMEQETGRRGLELKPVSHRTVIIREQEVPLTISEGTNQNGYPFRQVTGVFQGKKGPVLLTIIGPTPTWDQAAIDAFLTSIR
jgi:hypothetical protein